MNFSKLTLAVATVLGTGATSSAYAIDLYVDMKTKQIYAEPGRNRVLMGSFVQVDEAAQMAASKPAESAELAAVKEDLEMKTNEIKALQEHMTEAEKVKLTMDKKGLQVESADKNFKFKLGGRIHADANYTSGDDFLEDDDGELIHAEANDGTEIRRARMRFEGVFFKDWLMRTEADFADDNVRVKDAFLQYTGIKGLNITAGQQKQNFSRELQESSNDMMFTERSLMNILNNPTVDRAIGLNFETANETEYGAYVAKLGVFGDSITPARTGTTPEVDNAGDEGWGVSSRLIYNPILEKTKLIHLGIAGNYRAPDQTGDVAKSKGMAVVYETNNMSNLDLINTSIRNVDSIKMLGLEAAGMYGPFSVGGEYTQQWIDQKNGGENLALNGWYTEAAWSITGESRKYKEGNFRYLEPAKPFSLKNGGWGAWELATRYSSADLNDGDFLGGEISNFTTAVNWYINSNFRMMFNWTHLLDIKNSPLLTSSGDPISDGNTDLDTFTVRAQVAY